jgi:hypothetical protein
MPTAKYYEGLHLTPEHRGQHDICADPLFSHRSSAEDQRTDISHRPIDNALNADGSDTNQSISENHVPVVPV